MARPSHSTPAAKPIMALFRGAVHRGSVSFRRSGSQNNRVNPAADSRGISSAQNRQIAPLEESGKGISPVSTAQPRKKVRAFPAVIKNFFMMRFLLCA